MTARFALALFTLVLSTPAFAATEKYAIDTTASQVNWEGRKKIVDTRHVGIIGVKGGQVELSGDKITAATIEIDMTAITNTDLTDSTYNQKLIGHLKSEDFFNVEHYPTSKFVLKSAKAKKGKDGATHTLTGDLTLKTETHSVTFPASIAAKDGVLTGRATLSVDRTKWGIRYGSGKFFKGLGDKVIRDEIKLEIVLTAKKG